MIVSKQCEACPSNVVPGVRSGNAAGQDFLRANAAHSGPDGYGASALCCFNACGIRTAMAWYYAKPG
jgi:hypothetical protein